MLRLLLVSGALLCYALLPAQDRYTISGYLEEAGTGEKLIGANVYDERTNLGTTTNTYGFFSLTLPADSIYLRMSYIGYETIAYDFYLSRDTTMTAQLGEGTELTTVVVDASKGDRIEERTQMSTMEIPVDQIKKVPALLGEVDILKTLQLLPGVQSGSEGSSGLYVRGGSPDQNLILLDGVPVYNASHLFGFFSVFNADAIKSVTLTKGGYPARFGGRLSSVLEINMKEGNNEEFHGEGSIGLISSKLTLEGPINKGRTSFIVSGRRTYIDILAQPFIQRGLREEDIEGGAGYYFYDLNAKINHKIDDDNRIYASVYSGDDRFYVNTREEFNQDDISEFNNNLGWGNLTGALRYNRRWSPKLFSNTTLTYSRYALSTRTEFRDRFDGEEEAFGAVYLSEIEDWGGKIDFDYIPSPNHYIRFGANVVNHAFKPGALTFEVEFENIGLDTTIGNANIGAMEYAVYVEDDIKFSRRLQANIGVHASAFGVEGQTYFSVQPRLGVRYLAPRDVAVKASFSTMTQFINLLTNEGLGLPTDLWVPATDRILPQESWQAALGVAKTVWDDYEVSVEGYYRSMTNLVSYAEGAGFLSFDDWEDKVEQGDGESYGVELFFQKKAGKTTGWVGYTLSWSNRTFENINSGNTYPFKYDRRHDLSVVVAHDFNERISLSGAFVYGTGNALTVPEVRYQSVQSSTPFGSGGGTSFQSQTVNVPSEKNAYRMRDYHRLDVGISFKKQKKYWQRTWSFGFYNVYSRANPFFIALDSEYNDQTGDFEPVFRQYSLFPIIPYVTYGFKF